MTSPEPLNATSSPFALVEALLDVTPARYVTALRPVPPRQLPTQQQARRTLFDRLLNDVAQQGRLDAHFAALAAAEDAAGDRADDRDASGEPGGCIGWECEGDRYRAAAQAHREARAQAQQRLEAAKQELRRMAGVA